MNYQHELITSFIKIYGSTNGDYKILKPKGIIQKEQVSSIKIDKSNNIYCNDKIISSKEILNDLVSILYNYLVKTKTDIIIENMKQL